MTADSKLKSLVERAEKIIEERKAVSGDLTDIFAEAKGVGYDVKTMRRIIRERAMDLADFVEQETLADTYRHNLGMAVEMVSNGDMSLREAAKACGVSKSSVHRALAVPGVSREMVADDLGDPLWVVDKERAKFRDKVRAISATVKVPEQEQHIEGAADAGPMPAFLRRARA